MRKICFAFLFTLFCVITTTAQDTEVDHYNINVRVDTAASAMDIRATIAIVNLSQAPKSRIFLRLSKSAKVTAASVGGATAQFEIQDDRRTTSLNQLIISPPTAIAGGAKANVDITYRIEAPESNALITISASEVLISPDSVWVPVPSTGFALTGVSTAPFTLTASANNLRVASAGTAKGEAGNQTFEQVLNSVPFFVAGNFDQPMVTEQGGIKIEIYAQAGLQSADGKSSAKENLQKLGVEAGRIIDFLSKTFGALPAGSTFRIISSWRANNLVVPGALVLSEQTLRRDTLSANTIETLADALARMWIDGRARVRGQEARNAQAGSPGQPPLSYILVRDSLPRYLAALYIENAYGKDAGLEAVNRMRWIYTPIAQARRDAELDIQTLAVPTYAAAAFGKGPLVLRLFAETVGRDKFIAALRSLFDGNQTKSLTMNSLRQALAKDGNTEIEKLYQQWVDTIIEPDIVIGVPQASDKPNMQQVNIRNLGTGDVNVKVVATTASGKQLTATVLVPSENINSFDLPTAEKINSIEVDPDKLIIQAHYDNDAKPQQGWGQALFNEGIAAFNKNDFAASEAKFKEAAKVNPQNATIHAWLARALAAQNKNDDAAREANAALVITPTTTAALAWAHITLGQVALARNQAAEAVSNLRRAVVEAEETPAQYAARELAAKAERAAAPNAQADEAIRAFIAKFDTLIKQPSSDALYTIAMKSNLKRFVQGLVVSQPTVWTTEVLRADQIDANRLAVDVKITAKVAGRDQSGTAVFILNKVSSNWMLEEVQLFNVK